MKDNFFFAFLSWYHCSLIFPPNCFQGLLGNFPQRSAVLRLIWEWKWFGSNKGFLKSSNFFHCFASQWLQTPVFHRLMLSIIIGLLSIKSLKASGRNPPKGSANTLIWPSHTQLARAPQNLSPSQFLYITAKTYTVNMHTKSQQLIFYIYKMLQYQFSCDPRNCEREKIEAYKYLSSPLVTYNFAMQWFGGKKTPKASRELDKAKIPESSRDGHTSELKLRGVY